MTEAPRQDLPNPRQIDADGLGLARREFAPEPRGLKDLGITLLALVLSALSLSVTFSTLNHAISHDARRITIAVIALAMVSLTALLWRRYGPLYQGLGYAAAGSIVSLACLEIMLARL